MDHTRHITLSKTSLAKVIDGRKKIISCWFDGKGEVPDKVERSETIHLKSGNEPPKAKAVVSEILEFSDLTPARVHEILDFYGEDDGIADSELGKHKDKLAHNNYCMLIFLESVQVLMPVPAEVGSVPARAPAYWIRRPLSFVKAR